MTMKCELQVHPDCYRVGQVVVVIKGYGIKVCPPCKRRYLERKK